MTRRGGSGRHDDGHSPSRYNREGNVFDTVFSILASILASTVGGLAEGSRVNHVRSIAYGSSRPRTEVTAWPVVAFLEAAVAHRTADVVDNAAFLVGDQARDMFEFPIPAGAPNIDIPQ